MFAFCVCNTQHVKAGKGASLTDTYVTLLPPPCIGAFLALPSSASPVCVAYVYLDSHIMGQILG